MYSVLKNFLFCLFFFPVFSLYGVKQLVIGIDRVYEKPFFNKIEKKKVALFTNHTGRNSKGVLSSQIFLSLHEKGEINFVKIFCAEHGLEGAERADESISSGLYQNKIPLVSLYERHKKQPLPSDLKGIDLIAIDIQDLGCRSYTYGSTVFYLLEVAAKEKISVIIYDRPHIAGGNVTDGALPDKNITSIVCCMPVPYLHGMTLGELMRYCNIACQWDLDLTVVPVSGWKRGKPLGCFSYTWIPTSPHIPTWQTALYYPITGPIGELGIVNIGVGYTLPFQLIGAPWLERDSFIAHFKKLDLPGVDIHPFSFRPFFGLYKEEFLKGCLIEVTDPRKYRPYKTMLALLYLLNFYYPEKVESALKGKRRLMFDTVLGGPHVAEALLQKISFSEITKYADTPIEFERLRKQILLPEYAPK